jgi:hypothetical protein
MFVGGGVAGGAVTGGAAEPAMGACAAGGVPTTEPGCWPS